ncbi:MAG: hypothetical protein ACREQZ_02565 [Woeseiaceae bacterium]
MTRKRATDGTGLRARDRRLATAMLLLAAAAAAADPTFAPAWAPAPSVLNVDHKTRIMPDRWCIEQHMAMPSLDLRAESSPPALPASILEYEFYDAHFVDRSALSKRLADIEVDALITFWRGRTVGVFLGVHRGQVGIRVASLQP